MEENRTNNRKPASVILDTFENSGFFAEGEKKNFQGRETDCVRMLEADGTAYTITKRTLQNGDVFLFVEGKGTKGTTVEIRVGEIVKRSAFGHLYRKPAFDNRYGENKLTGNSCYLELKEGSAILSKVYYYREIFHEYESGDVSHILELKAEEDTVFAEGDTVRLELKEEAESFSFVMLLSREKLFDSEESLLEYEEFLHDSIYHNGVWSSWLIRPSGTYTKLPYSIEPFTREGYGYSLHHSSKKELLPLYRRKKERFYSDMMENAVYQAYLYQKQKNGVFYTDYTSTWLKKDTGIVSPYIDTRLNETFMLILSEFMEESGMDFGIAPMKDFADYMVSYEGEAYREGEGILYPDYFKDDAGHMAHASLNHQLSIANLLYQAHETYGGEKYREGFDRIIAFLEATWEKWINPETGDLLYGVKTEEDGSRTYFGNDYVYVTLGDLAFAQKNHMALHGGEKNEALRKLTAFKVNALLKTEHDVTDENAVPASGELLNSRETVLELLNEVYAEDAVISSLLEQKEMADAKDLWEMLSVMKAKQAGSMRKEMQKARQETQAARQETQEAQKAKKELQTEMQAEIARLQAEKADLKTQLEKRTSQFLFEQKKADDLKTKCSGYEARLNMYSKAKMFRLMIFTWKVSGNMKRKVKRFVYGFGHWLYVKLTPYPKLRRVFASLNAKLGIFKDTSKVITYNAKAAATGTQKKVYQTLKKPSQMNVAMIVDEFTFNSFKYECNALPIEPTNWREIFEKNDIDLFFCESAWSGNDPVRRPWKGKVYCSVNFKNENRGVLLEILQYCKEKGIPTVFWNKEDPTHYPDKVHNFVETAVKFDHVFTTDRGCVQRYKEDYGHQSVHLLMFATQPRLFNPIEKYDRTDEIIFAGSWYNQHPVRCEEMGGILDRIVDSVYPLKIYDRHSNANDPNHFFPERFEQYLNPSLPHDKMEIAYKSSKYALNINTVTDSDTMFARRVFELMSSNTLVLSNYSKGMEELFGDNVVFVDGKDEIGIQDAEEKRLRCLYNVLQHHTYRERFSQVLQDAGVPFAPDHRDITLIYRVGSMAAAEQAYEAFASLEYVHKKAVFYVLEGCDGKEFRDILMKYNGRNISVISESYCRKYEDVLKIDTAYFAFADENISNELIEKALYNFVYLEEGTGVTGVTNEFRYVDLHAPMNVVFDRSTFAKIKGAVCENREETFRAYMI